MISLFTGKFQDHVSNSAFLKICKIVFETKSNFVHLRTQTVAEKQTNTEMFIRFRQSGNFFWHWRFENHKICFWNTSYTLHFSVQMCDYKKTTVLRHQNLISMHSQLKKIIMWYMELEFGWYQKFSVETISIVTFKPNFSLEN